MVQLASNADATAASDLFRLLGPNRRVVVRDFPHAVHFAPHIREARFHWRPRVCVAQLEGVQAGVQVRVAACDTNDTHEMKNKARADIHHFHTYQVKSKRLHDVTRC